MEASSTKLFETVVRLQEEDQQLIRNLTSTRTQRETKEKVYLQLKHELEEIHVNFNTQVAKKFTLLERMYI